jgi:hypothetical protein
MLVDLDRVLATDPSLHRSLVQVLGWVSGERELNPLNLMDSERRKLMAWVRREQDRRVQREAQQPPPAPPEPTSPQPVAETPAPPKQQEEDPIFKEAMDPGEVQRRQELVDREAARARLQQYADVHGLSETDENFRLIEEWVKSNLKGYWSATAVDLSIQWLGPRSKNILQWKPKEAPAPPEPEPEPKEVLADWQLPIDASEAMMKKASVAALQDLIKRRRAATNQQYIRRRGGFGSSF